jgi:hypothetical protein
MQRLRIEMPVRVPASHPAYCYEWAFREPGRLVVLNLWHFKREMAKCGVTACVLRKRTEHD